MSLLYTNQVGQTPVRGQVSLMIAQSGILAGTISVNQSTTAIKAGDKVKLDATITTSLGTPQFVSALYTDVVFGTLLLDPQAASITYPHALQVACRFIGPIVFLLAGATVTPGSPVEWLSGSTYDVQNQASGKLAGVAIDYATIGNLTRVILVGAYS